VILEKNSIPDFWNLGNSGIDALELEAKKSSYPNIQLEKCTYKLMYKLREIRSA